MSGRLPVPQVWLGRGGEAVIDDPFKLIWPQEVDDVKEFFQTLPSGFVRDPYFGLGLNYDLRFITDISTTLASYRLPDILRSFTRATSNIRYRRRQQFNPRMARQKRSTSPLSQMAIPSM